MQQYLLGIDIGTGSTKAVGMALSGEILGVCKEHYPIEQPEPGYSEQDADLIFRAFLSCVAAIVQKIGYAPAAVSLSSAMHSLIAVNAEGHPLGNMITWADTRSEHIAQAIRDSANGELFYRTSGTPIHAMSPLGKIIWLRDHQPGLFHSAHKFISIKEYIWYQLFGQFEIDYSLASATGLFDIRKLEWSSEICAFAGIGISKLSIPVNTNYKRNNIIPAVAGLLNLPANTPFIIGASDGCCANLGTGATGPGVGALTIGTSGAVRVTGNAPINNFTAMTFNYLLNANTFVSGGAINNGGIAVDWLLKNFLNKATLNGTDYHTLFETIATIPAGSEGLIFLPYLYGERAPLWDAKASGAFINIKPAHTQAHFLRAGLEGICFALYHVLDRLEAASGTVTQLNVSGGFVSSALWMQLLANITGKKLALLQVEDASAIGAIYLAIPVIFPQAVLPQPVETSVIMPDAQQHEVYAKTFPIFKKLYGDIKATVQLLNQLN